MHPLARFLQDASTLGDLGRAYRAWHEATPAPSVPVSCRRGCTACCHQPVPLAPAEAFHLADIIVSSPGLGRRARQVRHRDRASWRRDPGVAAHRRWLQERIACPCLETDGSCGIHPQRPLACRQHLVTSPAARCSTADGSGVSVLPLRHDLQLELTELCARLMGTAPLSIPLPLAVGWANTNRRWRHRTWSRETILMELDARRRTAAGDGRSVSR